MPLKKTSIRGWSFSSLIPQTSWDRSRSTWNPTPKATRSHGQPIPLWGHVTSHQGLLMVQTSNWDQQGKTYLPEQKSRPYWKLHPKSKRHREKKWTSYLENPQPGPAWDGSLHQIGVTVKRGGLDIINTSKTQEESKSRNRGFLFSEHGLIPTTLGKEQSNCSPLVFVQITLVSS